MAVLEFRYYGNLLKHPWRQVFIDNSDLATPDRWMWRLADIPQHSTSRRHLLGPMVSLLTEPIRNSGDKPTEKDKQFMLNVDIALARDFSHSLDTETGQVMCRSEPTDNAACPDSKLSNKVRLPAYCYP